MKKLFAIILTLAVLSACIAGYDYDPTTTGSQADKAATLEVANELQTNQPTPTDIEYSLERYNLIRREQIMLIW